MVWAKYPSDKEILNVGLRGIHIGNYFKWSGYENYISQKKNTLGKKEKLLSREPIEVTQT